MVKKQHYNAPYCEQYVCNGQVSVICASVGAAESSFNDLDLVTGEIE